MKIHFSYKTKRILAFLISLCPTSAFRIFLYRMLFGYKFGRKCKLAIGAVIAVDAFNAGSEVYIGRRSRFYGPITVHIGDGVLVGKGNLFECGLAASDPTRSKMNYARSLVIGRGCLINDRHYFDIYGKIIVGEKTWIAGCGSQFWTHGGSVSDRDISIGARCYLGSAVRFIPGSGIGDDVVVAMAAVITKNLQQDNIVLGGVPAKIIRDRHENPDNFVFERWN